jgi:hypothetical protein
MAHDMMGRLIGMLVVTVLKVIIHESHKALVTSHELDQSRYIVLLSARMSQKRLTMTVREYAQ